jgi:putative DNA primase/helicase
MLSAVDQQERGTMSDPQALYPHIVGQLENLRGCTAKCPAHEDNRNSLSVSLGDDHRLLLHCHAGCSTEAICNRLRVAASDLFRTPAFSTSVKAASPAPNDRKFSTAKECLQSLESNRGKASAKYEYRDANGEPVGLIARWDHPDGKKDILPISRNGSGWHMAGMNEPRPLYQLVELKDARRVYVVEGEKCVDALRALGLIATTSPHGANSADKADWSSLAGLQVVILPDNDTPGEKYARTVAGILHRQAPAATVRVVSIPGLGPKQDVYDFIEEKRAAGMGDDGIRLVIEAMAAAAPIVLPRDKRERPEITTRLRATRLSDVMPARVRWLWEGRIPQGKLSLLSGDPGLGKSFLTLDLTAHVTCGLSWPDGAPGPEAGGVILFSAEDDVTDTIRPRLDAAGADVSRVIAVNGVDWAGSESQVSGTRSVDFARDLPMLRHLATENPGVRLIIVDPISAYCGKTDSHNNAEVRAMLAPLAEMAAELGIAVVAVTHLAKGSGGKALYRSMGSLAFAAAARAVWYVTKDRDDPARRLFLPAKMNLCRDPSGLAYRIVGDGICEPRIDWEQDPVPLTADDALAAETEAAIDSTDREQVVDWLKEVLDAGPLPARDVQAQARECGFSSATLRRAKKDVGVLVTREGYGKEGKWRWKLPAAIDAHQTHRCSPIGVSTNGKSEHLWTAESSEEGLI